MKKLLRQSCLALLMFVTGSTLPAADEEPGSQAFLEHARYPGGGNSYAKLEGWLQHKKDSQSMEEYPAALGIIIGRDKTNAQLVLGDKEEYRIVRNNRPGKDAELSVTSSQKQDGKETIAQRTGLNPADLTTGFLFYNFLREDGQERVSAIPCRVLILEAPDKSEIVRVYLARAYAFALRAEFYKDLAAFDADEPLRTLETRSFKKKNGLYYAELLNIRGPNWQSRVHFTKAELGIPDGNTPTRIFRSMK